MHLVHYQLSLEPWVLRIILYCDEFPGEFFCKAGIFSGFDIHYKIAEQKGGAGLIRS